MVNPIEIHDMGVPLFLETPTRGFQEKDDVYCFFLFKPCFFSQSP